MKSLVVLGGLLVAIAGCTPSAPPLGFVCPLPVGALAPAQSPDAAGITCGAAIAAARSALAGHFPEELITYLELQHVVMPPCTSCRAPHSPGYYAVVVHKVRGPILVLTISVDPTGNVIATPVRPFPSTAP